MHTDVSWNAVNGELKEEPACKGRTHHANGEGRKEGLTFRCDHEHKYILEKKLLHTNIKQKA